MKRRNHRRTGQTVSDAERRSELVRRLQANAADLAYFPDKEVENLIATLYRTLDALEQPEPDVRHVHDLRYAIEVALAIERGRVVKGLRLYIDQARASVLRLIESDGPDGNVVVVSAQDLAVFKELVELHKFQLDKITVGEYKKAVYSAAGAIGGRMQAIINSNR